MNTAPFAVSLDLKLIAAGCGHVYAVPSWMFHHLCPLCSSRDTQKISERLNQQIRSNATLRGVITRLKKGTRK